MIVEDTADDSDVGKYNDRHETLTNNYCRSFWLMKFLCDDKKQQYTIYQFKIKNKKTL